jgi:hypothetical protein
MRLKSTDYFYVFLSCFTGVWQAWCANYGRNSIFLALVMSLPFALTSYGHAWLLNKTGVVEERPNWKRMIALWVGMPLSFMVGSLTILIETRILYAAGFRTNPPFHDLRLLIGEGAACVAWTACILLFLGNHSLSPSRSRLLILSGVLYAGVLLAYGFAFLVRGYFRNDVYLISLSVLETALSALIVVLTRAGVWSKQRSLTNGGLDSSQEPRGTD